MQEQEYRGFAEYLQENTEKVISISPSSDDYSVYCSEIHSDDSENTINKKLEVKELEKPSDGTRSLKIPLGFASEQEQFLHL